VESGGLLLTRTRLEYAPQVWVGKDFRAGPNSTIGGNPIGVDDPQGGIEIGDKVRVGPGSVIMLGIEKPTKIGNRTAIGALCSVGHETIIEEGVTILNGSHLAGWVHVGKGAYLAFGVIVRNRVKIGPGSFIGQGSNVVEDIPANVVAFGNPCRVVRRRRRPISYYLRRWFT